MALSISRGRMPQRIPGAEYSPTPDVAGAIGKMLPLYMQAAQQARESKQRRALLETIGEAAQSPDSTEALKGAVKELEGMEPAEVTTSSILDIAQRFAPDNPVLQSVMDRKEGIDEMGTLGKIGRAFSPVAQPTGLIPAEEGIIAGAQPREVREMEMFNRLAEIQAARARAAAEEPDLGADPLGLGIKLDPEAPETPAPVEEKGHTITTDRQKQNLELALRGVRHGIENHEITTRDQIVEHFRARDVAPEMYPEVEKYIDDLEAAIDEAPEKQKSIWKKIYDAAKKITRPQEWF